jgi:hypothetical protein
MSAFDPIAQKGIPYHLRASTPEELDTHRRLIAKMEAIRRQITRQGGVHGTPNTRPSEERASRAG